MLNSNHSENIKKETETAKIQNESILDILENFHTRTRKKNMIVQNYLESDLSIQYKNSAIENLVKEVNSLINKNKGLTVEIYQDSEILYSNTLQENIDLETGERSLSIYIKENQGKSILYTCAKTVLEEKQYYIRTSRDITNIYSIREKQIEVFTHISIIFTLLLACLLAIAIYFITRRIKKLEKEIVKVSKGDYSVCLPQKGSDEISTLNIGVQTMINSINHNIKELERISENRQNFINDMTHEIRTPLTSIIGFSELLINVKITDEKILQKYATKIYEEGKYIENLTEALIQLVMLENKNIIVQEKNISDITKKAIEMARDMLAETVRIEEKIERNVFGMVEESLIQSLILNLIKNASKSYEGGGIVRITLTKEKLEIMDQGKGIPEEEIQKIVEPFYTLNKARNRKQEGLGLGLPLCMKIAEIHGFKFQIQSQLNIGTIVTILFKNSTNKDNKNEK